MLYSVLSLDMWGNEADGWVVNGAYYSGRVIDIVDIDDDDAIVQALIADDVLPDDVTKDDITIDGDKYSLYISQVKDNQPLWHLQPQIY